MDTTAQCVEAYRKTRNLKLVGADLGIPWQSVYVHLRKAGEPVIGDKERYGSDKDRLAARGEAVFQQIVPFARDQNKVKFQSKVDFLVGSLGVDVKSSRLKTFDRKGTSRRWGFSIKKQEAIADFFILICFDGLGETAQRIILVPGEIARMTRTISVPESGGKWADYYVELDQIRPFFESLQELT